VRRVLKAITWVIGGLLAIAVVAIATLFGINATDVPLSEDAKALLRRPAPPQPSPSNGYLDYLALGAPADAPTFATGVAQLALASAQRLNVEFDPRVRKCYNEFLSCVAKDPALKEVMALHPVFLTRYRAMREKPEFIDLEVLRTSPEEPLHAYWSITSGHRLTLTRAAIEFNAGHHTKALDELEAELRFHRTMATGSRSLIAKMISFAMLDSDALFAAELARHLPAHHRPQWARLKALLRPLTKAELNVSEALRESQAELAGWMSTRRFVRMSDSLYESIRTFEPNFRRPWWDPIAPWLYRPHYSVNRYVAQSLTMMAVAERPASDFLAAQRVQRIRMEELDRPIWKPLVLSPAGTFHWELAGSADLSDYIGRMHAVSAVNELATLQIQMRAAGITKPADVKRALAGSLGKAHLNPFTGMPVEFNAAKMTIGFACELKLVTGGARPIAADGRIELPL
jgi:hypothetical protein